MYHQAGLADNMSLIPAARTVLHAARCAPGRRAVLSALVNNSERCYHLICNRLESCGIDIPYTSLLRRRFYGDARNICIES